MDDKFETVIKGIIMLFFPILMVLIIIGTSQAIWQQFHGCK
jgi:hypothetical protein